MHAFLFVGNSEDDIETQIGKLVKKYTAKRIDSPIEKVDDVRNLNKILRLSFSEPTLIVCKNIHLAGEESLNALLKNIEEPQKNIYFALSTPSVKRVIPTIVSRCQIVYTNHKTDNEGYDSQKIFMDSNTGIRFKMVEKIKDRKEAILFIERLIIYAHSMKNFNYLEMFLETLSNIKKNGNVSLQLANLVVTMENAKSINL